jgi:hypothetical protein
MGGTAENEVYVPPHLQQQPQPGGVENQSSSATTNTTSVANAPTGQSQSPEGGHVPTASTTTATSVEPTSGTTHTSKGAVELLQDAANCAHKIDQQQRMFRGYWNKFKRSIVAIQKGFNLIASCCKK